MVYVGVDVGSASAKLAALAPAEKAARLAERLSGAQNFRVASPEWFERVGATLIVSFYRPRQSNPLQAALDLLDEFRSSIPDLSIRGVRVTGSGGSKTAERLQARYENEFRAIARGVSVLHPEVRTVFEIGGENSKYLLLEAANRNGQSGGNGYGVTPVEKLAPLGILDYSTSGECAAGTGSFIDQQASRLRYSVEEIGGIVTRAKRAARIAGRCSVFAKSDMIHAQQKGYGTDEVLKGLCEAVARNFKSNIVKGKKIVPPVAIIGGVSQNAGVVQALAQALRMEAEQMLIPELHAWLGAIGAALLERAEGAGNPSVFTAAWQPETRAQLAKPDPGQSSYAPLSLQNVLLLRDHPEATRTALLLESGQGRLPVYLGIDIGSVSTNLAVLDEDGRLLHGIYLRTAGRPIEVVNDGLQEIDRLLGSRIEIRGVGTTGSGRELIGELVGADTVNDEITAHKTGAMHVHERLVRRCAAGASVEPADALAIGPIDTIFEIGGQDSKFISIDRGIVVDFAMNEACAAGTGSFLEEQAERLGIQIKDEFARLALSSQAPARLGERCTVFMEHDVTGEMQRGRRLEDVTAGLAYSVVLNYLNRVVRRRRIGSVIYFQGGTAYNDAVAAAFSQVLGKPIIVPPHNGIIGAIGMALIAQEVIAARRRRRESGPGASAIPVITAAPSSFRGFDLNQTRFQTREFVCKACSNYCDLKEITVEGRKTYWGDKCSDKFRKRARTDRQPVIEDLLALRDRLLLEGFVLPGAETAGGRRDRGRIGIPQAMFFYDRFPFWRAYLETLGFEVVISDPTDRYIAARGTELSVAEPCFPVQLAHGHVQSLLEGKTGRASADFVLLPNVMDMEAPTSKTASYLCPWNQTLPFVVQSASEFASRHEAFVSPTVYFSVGQRQVARQLAEYFAGLGVRRRENDVAVEAAYSAQDAFQQKLLEAGREACAVLEKTGEPAVLLVGRPYNVYDRGANCDIPRKLRDLYGVNVLPFDFLPVDDLSADELHPNMYWNSGRRTLAAGRFARERRNLHLIYITNFKCGPDSFVKHFLRETAGSPFLVLQFDGHGNDAGYLTRCEAYLDSKGILRCAS